MPIYSDREKACVRFLADRFYSNEYSMSVTAKTFPIDGELLEEHEFGALMRTMQGFGVIDEVSQGSDAMWSFNITHVAVQLAREIEREERAAQEPEDVVEKVHSAAKGNRLLAWIIVIVGIITTAAVLVAAILTIIDKIIDLRAKLGQP